MIGNQDKLEKIVALAKRRGFVYPGSEIYGGLGGFYDYGPLGVELKFNIKQWWWRDIVQKRDEVVGLSAATIMNPRAWEASGHVGSFSDLLVECSVCHKRFKLDDLGNYSLAEAQKAVTEGLEFACPACGKKFKGRARQFNLMFKTFVGPLENETAVAYLRPETAGGIFLNFKNILDTMRVKIPFGIAQIGRAFRNEVNPKNYIFRTREFEQMELEYFVNPKESEKYFNYWVKERLQWYQDLGFKNIRKREQSKEERAHYSKATIDIEYKFPFGWQEIEGIANRADFDLQAHAKASGVDLSYFDEETKKRYIPYVIEPSAGVERIALALLCEAYTEEKDRIVLQFHPKIAPIKVAVFPLLANKPKLVELARQVYQMLKLSMTNCQLPTTVVFDDRGNIGKRYYSQDEIGTPFCVTIDFESLEKKDVTVRDRDTAKQVRIKIAELTDYFKDSL